MVLKVYSSSGLNGATLLCM